MARCRHPPDQRSLGKKAVKLVIPDIFFLFSASVLALEKLDDLAVERGQDSLEALSADRRRNRYCGLPSLVPPVSLWYKRAGEEKER